MYILSVGSTIVKASEAFFDVVTPLRCTEVGGNLIYFADPKVSAHLHCGQSLPHTITLVMVIYLLLRTLWCSVVMGMVYNMVGYTISRN